MYADAILALIARLSPVASRLSLLIHHSIAEIPLTLISGLFIHSLFTLPYSFHVHVRQGEMCELVTPHVAKGGIRTAYVMVSGGERVLCKRLDTCSSRCNLTTLPPPKLF